MARAAAVCRAAVRLDSLGDIAYCGGEMSLDVYLRSPTPMENTQREHIFVRRSGANVGITRAEWDELYPGREQIGRAHV